MKKCCCILFVLGAFATVRADVFEHTYCHAPLYEVLQDIEHTFGLSFMYQPSDIANAPEITDSFHSNDYEEILRKVLPPTIQCVRKKSILVLVKKEAKKEVGKTPIIPPQAKIITPSTPVADTVGRKASLEPLIPIEYLRPANLICVHIDPRKLEPFNPDIMRPVAAPVPVGKPLAHAFVPSISIGYGSQLQTRIDLHYRLRFKQYWAFSAGLNADYTMSPQNNSAAHEIGLGLPLNFHYIRPFHSTIPHLTGWQTTIGFMPYFPVAHWGGTITTIGVDLVPSVGLDLLFDNTKILGLYGQCSALNGVPWSIGVRFSYIIGDK